MKVSSTLSQSGETTERNLTIPNFVYIGLRDTADLQNKEFSQGKVLYEILHFDREKPCSDDISEIEEFVDTQLANQVGEQSASLVDKIKIIGVEGRQALVNGVPDDLDPEEMTDFQVRVRLPDSTWEQIHEVRERGIGKWAAPSLAKFVESAFSSRTERINCKREMVEYLQDDIELEDMESEVARACVIGESERYAGVEKVHNFIHEVNASEWSENITVGDLKAMSGDDLQSIGLGQKSKDERVKALETAIENDGRQPEPDEVQELVKEVYGVKTDQTARSYVQEMEMDWMGPQVESVRELANEIKREEVYGVEGIDDMEGLSESSRSGKNWNPKQVGENMPVYEFLLLDKDKLDRIDRRYESVEDALEALDELLEQAKNPDRLGKPRKDAYDKFKRHIEFVQENGVEPKVSASIEDYDGA